ncbi:hypothetical protein PR048_029564 [Dryococelus australis]|uniref:Uncharacterized protein n=1 Tax=Dryococelus australis TaxID=614101 RepID=A0ABQ9GGD0_9NEOP|nr:hypothetical protein PR048_029564 [Dryococelus australis]
MASAVIIPAPLTLAGNIAAHWKSCKQNFEIYMIANGNNAKTDKLPCYYPTGEDRQKYAKQKTCEFSDLEDSSVQDRIIVGIRSTSLRESLLRLEDLTLQQAITHCETSEKNRQQKKPVRKEEPQW